MKPELIDSPEFENALLEGASLRKDLAATFKTSNKSAFAQFYETMLNARPDIQKILDVKKKNRDEEMSKTLQNFKSMTRQMYFQTQNFILEDKVEDGKKTKAQKLVDKIFPLIQMLKFIGSTQLEEAFAEKGISINVKPLEEDNPLLLDKKEAVKGILLDAKSIKKTVVDGNRRINEDIYATKVPIELQYDKHTNNSGIKTGDFRRLVEMKTKLIIAKTKEAKEKADEKIQHAAAEKQFEIARAQLVRDKLSKME